MLIQQDLVTSHVNQQYCLVTNQFLSCLFSYTVLIDFSHIYKIAKS